MQTSTILDIAQANGGVVTSAMVDAHGVSRGILKHLTDAGRLERRARGVYYLPGISTDALFDLHVQYTRGIYSHGSALALLGLLDASALDDVPHMTFPAGYNTSGARARGLVAHVSKTGLHELGVCEVDTPAGHRVRSYNAERALCTVARLVNDPLMCSAFRRYEARPDANPDVLARYAALLRVEHHLRSYIRRLRMR